MSRLSIALLCQTALIGGLIGCRSPSAAEIDAAEVDAAELSYYPSFRSTSAPKFAFTAAERDRARRDFRHLGAEVLAEAVVDADGRIVRLRLVRTSLGRDNREAIEDRLKDFRFAPDEDGTGYRGFLWPVRFNLETGD